MDGVYNGQGLHVTLVVKEWVNSRLEHVEDGGVDDEHEVCPEGSHFDGVLYLNLDDAERLAYWMRKGYYILTLVNRP